MTQAAKEQAERIGMSRYLLYDLRMLLHGSYVILLFILK
jgi:hypothetical protein